MHEEFDDQLQQNNAISISQKNVMEIVIPSIWPISFEVSDQDFSYADEYLDVFKTCLDNLSIPFFDATCDEDYDIEVVFSLAKFENFMNITLDIHTEEEIVYSIDYNFPPGENKALIADKIRNIVGFWKIDLLDS